MRKLISIIYILTLLNFSAQFEIKWSELLPAKGRVASLFPVSYSDFYTTRYQGSMMFSSFYISKHTDFKVTSNAKIVPKLENGIGILEDVRVIKSVPVAFISDIKDGYNSLYVQKFNSSCEALDKPKKISSFAIPKGWKRKGFYNIHTSNNNEFICINYEIPGSKDEKDRFGYKIFDYDFELKSEGEYELPFPSNLVTISNYYLSDKGDFFFAAKVYEINTSKRLVKSLNTLEKVVLYQVTPNGILDFDLTFKEGKTISDLTFSSDQNRIMTFTGLYGELKQNGIKGVFYFQLDFNNKTIISEGWKEFGKEFITEDWTEREKEKAEKREAKGKGEPQLYEYDVRDILTLKDGSMIGILEQYYVKVISNTDPRTGSTTTTYYYYYNDVILYKVNPKGEFAWLKKINKTQMSTNDYGYFSSIAYFISKDKLNIFFNDNLRNYTDSGDFDISTNELYPTSYRKKSNTVAHVEVDINSGNINRKTFFNRNEMEAYAVPKKFYVDYNKNEMLMLLLYGKKEKYGILTFE